MQQTTIIQLYALKMQNHLQKHCTGSGFASWTFATTPDRINMQGAFTVDNGQFVENPARFRLVFDTHKPIKLMLAQFRVVPTDTKSRYLFRKYDLKEFIGDIVADVFDGLD